MSERGFFAELKRRNVVRMAGLYLVGAWLLVQVTGTILPMFGAPDWLPRTIVMVLAIGFIPALIFSWIFELTPEGLKRDEELAPEQSTAPPTARRLDRLIIVVLVFALGYFCFDKFILTPRREAALLAATVSPNEYKSSIAEKSIAVLPFDNLSEDKSNAFFAEGVQDEILTRLARVADLKVISRTSTQKYKSAPDNLRDIAKQLGVMHVVEGSVQKASDQVRVNVQLINAVTDAHLWADTYDRKLTDIFAVESEIAKTIADMLQAKLSGSEKMMMAKKPTANPEAYELYLKGRFLWNRRNAADLRKSIDYFKQAIAKDPNYALAYAGLAQSWMVLPAYNGGAPAETCPQAEPAARKALALDETSTDALVALASYKATYAFDFHGALQEYERAIRLNPNDATAHHWIAIDVLANIGDQEREIAEMKRAVELDPLSLVLQTNLANAYVHSGRLNEAIAQFRKTIELDSTFYFAQYSHGLALELQGNIAEATAHFEKAAAISDDPLAVGMLGHIYGIAGRKDEAHKLLERLRESRKQHYTAAYALALISLGLGDRTQALDWLEQGYRDHDGTNMGPIRIDPLLKPLHGDRRFEALAEKIIPLAQFKAAPAWK
jgi:TolB-like protein/tetratricopeptide (TPR) repeat protein